jgi:hypothetical protein
MTDKVADLAGPGIGNYEELEKILPDDYSSLLTPKETQRAIFAVKNYIEENLCRELKSTTTWTATAPAPPSSSTSPTTTTSIPSTPRWFRLPPSGSGWR